MLTEHDLRLELRRLIQIPEYCLFAVVDGASFEDLHADLIFAGLPFKALYKDEYTPGSPSAGPHLVSIFDEPSITRVFDVLEGTPAAVWWLWPNTTGNPVDQIFKHLRSLNLVEIPTDRYDAEAPEVEEEGADISPYEPVLFRHADPNAMALVLPQLEPHQISRVLGDSPGVLLDSPEFGGKKYFHRPLNLPPKPAGLLRLRGTQYAAIGRGRISLVEHGVARYLREVAPEYVGGWTDEQLDHQVKTWVAESGRYGVRKEANHCRWAYLQVISGGALSGSKEIEEAMTDVRVGAPPDARVKMLMQSTIEQLKAMT